MNPLFNVNDKAWVVLQFDYKTQQMVTIAGTEDRRAINAALAAMKLYKDKCAQDDKLDLTLIKQQTIEDISAVGQLLESEDDALDKMNSVLGSVDIKNSK